MREIRFRVWNKEEGKMKDPDNFTITLSPPVKSEFLQWVIMQYTGLKDKNSKEIYEGDLVRCSDQVLAVKWDEKLCGFTLEGLFFQNYFPSKIEVIGNIYEDARV